MAMADLAPSPPTTSINKKRNRCSMDAQTAKILATAVAISGFWSRIFGSKYISALGMMRLNGFGMSVSDGKKQTPQEIELEKDAWQRFERAVEVVSKSPPQHRTKKMPKRRRNKSQNSVASKE